MAEQRENVNIAIIGHVDHGKTTLTAALTAMSHKLGYGDAVAYDRIDGAPEEQERGITIRATTVPFGTPRRNYAGTDCPGHKDFIRNMITGATNADVACLVVAADDGVMSQTKEHVLLARQAGIEHVIVVINKVDAVELELVDLVEQEVIELLEQHGYKNCPIIRLSALAVLNEDPAQEKAVVALMDAFDAAPLPPKSEDKPFLLSVETVYVVKGQGTVVAGKVEQGVARKKDPIEIVSGKRGIKSVVISGIHMFHKEKEQARPRDNVGLLVRGVSKAEVESGDIIAAPGTVKPRSRFKAEVYVLTPEEGGRKNAFKAGYQPQFFMRLADITGKIELIEATEGGNVEAKEFAMPGDHVMLSVSLLSPAGIEKGMRFAIREGGRTIGSGLVIEVMA